MKPVVGILLLIAFQMIGMGAIYGICRLFAAMGLQRWVFPVWLLGIPVGFCLAVTASLYAVLQMKR